MTAPTPTTLQRLAIVNRGEPAMRLINAVREWNEAGRSPITTIALYTAADRRAMFVREADESVLIGPSDSGGDGGDFGPSPYLDHAILERALRACSADAVWPGWGFVAEQAEFVELCDRMGITFVGPSAQVMRLLGDKIEAKRLAERAGVPLAAWSGGPVTDPGHAREQAEKIGYPLMVKATAGGGGRGIRLVTDPGGLDEAVARASAEGLSTAGNATVFLEKALRGGRHVEVQVVADAAGTVWTLGMRDCSVQRRNQKVIEESSSTALDAELEDQLRAGAAALIREAGYTNAGTVEFLFDPKERLLSFLEVNTRLQVEHPVTEMTTGTDIVKLQLHIAAGGTLDGNAPPASGHAIEARLTAEDPQQGFAPAPGRIEHLALPGGPGIRVDTGVAAGDDIPPQFDSMIAKVIAWGSDRAEARARLRRALHQTVAVIDGGTTNKSFLLDLLDRPEFRSGEIDTMWLDRLMADGYTPVQRFDVALLAVAVEAHEAHERRQQARLYSSAERGRPDVDSQAWFQVDVRAAGHAYRLRVARSGPDRYRVVLGAPTARNRGSAEALDVEVARTGRFELRLTAGDRTFAVLVVAQGPDFLVEVGGAEHRISGGEAGLVRAPAPAMVVAIRVAPGDEVAEGDVVAVVESMKLETALRAPFGGRVAEVLVDPNTQVEAGAKLVRMEPAAAGAAEESAAGDRLDLTALLASTPPRPAAAEAALGVLSELRALVLGFYVDERGARSLMRRVAAVREELPIDDPAFLAGEIEVLRIVADLCVLSRNRRVSDETVAADDSARNPQEYLNAYLRSRDAEAEELPESFRIKLRRALAHYGVTDLEPTPELGPALYRMYLAHRGAAAHAPVVSDLLQWRLDHPESLSAEARDAYRQVLDHVVSATQLRHPAIGDLARQVRYRCFDAPLIAAERSRVQRAVGAQLDRLASDPATRAGQIDAMVAAGEPILGVFAERHHATMLEVMTRRYYRIRPLEHVVVTERAGRPVLTAQYSHGGQDYTVLATVSRADISPADAQDLLRLVASVPPGRIALVDVYVTSAEEPGDLDARAERIREKLGTAVPATVGRIAVAVRRPDGEQGGPTWFTFRGDAGGQVEDRALRGLHPMVAERLDLWRLSAFELTRLPSLADVQLFDAQGRDVPDDRRLIVLADVRELTTLRDDDGSIRGLPQLEHALDACLDSLRAARSADPAVAKLAWNRVQLYVWPAVDIPMADLERIVRSLAPRTEALGIDQVLVQFRTPVPSGAPRERMLRMTRPPGAGLTLRITDPPAGRVRELDSYGQKVIKARRRGATYPYELVPLITRSPDRGGAAGTFTEYDLNADGSPMPVDRAPGGNTANLVLGVVTTPTHRYPEGMTRVVLLGDPTIALGAIAEPECRRVIAAVELARRFDSPVEWFAVSAGAKIAMDSGSETMDWVSRVLRSIIEFTQDGGEMNVVVTGITVGAQPYWNAEATMLMHTKGILVMTPDSTMVLTGKQSLDHSGGVSAEDNFGIGGYDRIMGPNGQAQYWAPDLSAAVDVLLAHYAHTYTAPGERFPRAAPTTDPVDRDIRSAPHSGPGCEFTRLGEIFEPATNAERKKPFDIRSVLHGVADTDHPTLERWPDMHAAESVVVLDAHLGGQPIALIGIESRPLQRAGVPPVDGPTQWTAGTLFPRSSKKTARAINAASGNRPLVVLANLSGFDGSPESLRGLQLEYGAEIGRAMVNFAGPIVFCVISRYHGGAFVVFSGTLNDNMEVAAVEGSYASVIGGAPAAAVVFAGVVAKRTAADPRIADRMAAIDAAAGDDVEVARLRAELAAVRPAVRSQMLGTVAEEFDTTHSIERALRMGSVDVIVSAERLRPYLADAVQRGMARTLGT